MVHIVDILHFFLGYSKLIAVIDSCFVKLHALSDDVLSVRLVEEVLRQYL